MKKNKQEFLKVVEAEILAVSTEKGISLSAQQIEDCAKSVALDSEETLNARIGEAIDATASGDESSVEVDVGSVVGVVEDIDFETTSGNTVTVPSDSFLVVNPGETEGLFLLDYYDADSNLVESDLVVSQDVMDDLLDNDYIELIPEDQIEYVGEDVSEAVITFRHGKMKKFTLKAKKGFKRVGSKYVKISAQTIAKMRKNIKKASRKANVGAAKLLRKRSMRLRKAKVQDSVNTNLGYEVVEGFDVLDGHGAEKKTILLQTGDTLSLTNEGTLKMDIYRNGQALISGVAVDEHFLTACKSENLIKESSEEVPATEPEVEVPATEPKVEGEEVPATEPKVEGEEVPATEPEAEVPATEPETPVAESILTFRNDKGYVLTKEGKDVVLGNRVRARSYLLNEGFNVVSATLDGAFNGKKVTL